MDIIKVIQETATWIEKVNNNFNTNLFRSEELSPHYFYPENSDSEKSAVIDKIISTRSTLLAESGVELIPVSELHHYGRIMIFDPDSTVVDGAPEAESAGYVDGGDAPPWDTWMALGWQLSMIQFYDYGHDIGPGFLIAWVPESHYFYANGALEVACMDNFAWPSNEFIRSRYDSIKELFSKPVIKEPDSEPFYPDKTSRILNVVQEELERNSKLYYSAVNDQYEGKKSFWSKLAIWKARK
jgi:hypothetical protein